MIFNLDIIDHIYIATKPIDFRKAINGLVAIIEYEFCLSSTERALFLFTNKRRNSIKIVYYDTNGYWLFQKTLLNNDKFIWAKDECCDTTRVCHL